MLIKKINRRNSLAFFLSQISFSSCLFSAAAGQGGGFVQQQPGLVGPGFYHLHDLAVLRSDQYDIENLLYKIARLLHVGADPNGFLDPYKTLFTEVVAKSPVEVVRLLANWPTININEQVLLGKTPLMVAVETRRPEVVRVLLENKTTNPNIKNDMGNTALMMAVRRGNVEIVKTLLARRENDGEQTDPNIQDKAGQTALNLAVQYQNPEIVKALIEHEKTDPTEKSLVKNLYF